MNRFFCYFLVIHRFNRVSLQVLVVVNRHDHLLKRNLVQKNAQLSIHRVELFHFMDFPCWVRRRWRRSNGSWSSSYFLVAPMCFVFEDPVHLYFIFRQFYTKYFFNLHHISASPNVSLIKISPEENSSIPGHCCTLCSIWKFITTNFSGIMVSYARNSSSTVRLFPCCSDYFWSSMNI